MPCWIYILSIHLFNKESVLFRTSEENTLKFWGKEKNNVYSPQFIMIFFIVMLLLLFYIGGSWQSKDLMQGLFKTQLYIILLPVLLVLRVSKNNIPAALKLNRTRPENFLLVILMAVPALFVAAGISSLINLIFPVSETYLRSMNELVSIDQFR